MRSSMLQWSAAACAALALTACEDNRNRAMQEPGPNNATPQGQAQNPQNQNQGQRPAGGVEAVNDAPSRFYGKKLSLVGDVDEVYNDRAFELDGADWAFNDNITVLTKNPVSVEGAPLRSSDDIVVSGTVRPFAVADIEKEIGWDIPADLENKLNKRPVLVADTIHKMTGCGTWSVTGATEPAASVMALVTTNDMNTLNGRKVDLLRERVQSVSGRGLWVGPSRLAQVFVLPAVENKNIKAGDWVTVTGTLAKTPRDAAKTWNLPTAPGGYVLEELVYVDNATVTPSVPGEKPANNPGANPGTSPGLTPMK